MQKHFTSTIKPLKAALAIFATTGCPSPSQGLAADPDKPTVAKSNVPGCAADSGYHLYAPADTPQDVIARLNAAASKAVLTDTFREQVEGEGFVISAGTPVELDPHVRAEETPWRKVVKKNNIAAD